jgi:hypothetical protein
VLFSEYWIRSSDPCGSPRLTPWEVAGWGGFAIAQAVVILNALRAVRALDEAPERTRLARTYLPKAVAYAFLVLVVVAMTSAMVRRPRDISVENSAVANLRAINSAQVEFEQTHPETGYASTLFELREAEFLSEALAIGEDSRYHFTLEARPPGSSGRILAYGISAEPSFRPRRSCRSFFTDESGVIRFTVEDRAATSQDTPWQ